MTDNRRQVRDFVRKFGDGRKIDCDVLTQPGNVMVNKKKSGHRLQIDLERMTKLQTISDFENTSYAALTWKSWL